MNIESFYLTIINNLDDGVYVVDIGRNILFWNKAAEEITGYKSEEVVGENCKSNILDHIDYQGKPLCKVGCPLYASMCDGKMREEEVFLKHKEGYRIPVMVKAFPLVENNKVIGAMETFSQTSPKVYEDKLIDSLINVAMRDELTGLFNRRYMQSVISYKLSELKRIENNFCILFLDIDDFGKFNNDYGHELGDIALKKMSKAIKLGIKKSDMICRWGGEEFVAIFELEEEVANPDEIFKIAERVRKIVSKIEIKYKEVSLGITISIGATLATKEDNVESLIDRADKLMYKSKEDGKNRVTVK